MEAERELFTFWGKLKKNKSLVTSEGTLKGVLYESGIPTDLYGYFLVEKRKKKYIILNYLDETKINEFVKHIASGSR